MGYEKYEKEIAEWQAKYEESVEHGDLVGEAVEDWLRSRYRRPEAQDRDYYRHIKDREERDMLHEETGHYGITDIHGKLTTIASSKKIEVVQEGTDADVSSMSYDTTPNDVLTIGEMYEMLLEEMDLMTPDNRTILFEYIFGEWQSKRGFFNHIQDVLKERGTPMTRATISERLIKGDFKGKERYSRPGGAAIVEWRGIRTMRDYERFTYRGITTYRRSLSFARKIDNQRQERREEQERIMNLPRLPDGTRHPEKLALLLDRIRQQKVYILLFRYMLTIEKAIGFWPIPKSGYTAEHFQRYNDLYEESEDVVAVAKVLLEDCNIK
jgi:hypothetical protein